MKDAIAASTDPTGELVVCIVLAADLADRLAKLSPYPLQVAMHETYCMVCEVSARAKLLLP